MAYLLFGERWKKVNSRAFSWRQESRGHHMFLEFNQPQFLPVFDGRGPVRVDPSCMPTRVIRNYVEALAASAPKWSLEPSRAGENSANFLS
jgi:hypothetical protein